MTAKAKFVLAHDQARRNAAAYCMSAPAGLVVRFSEPVKKREQEEAYHARIGEIAAVVPFMGEMVDAETWKRLLVDAFVRVMREEARGTGKPDPFDDQGRIVPSICGSGVVQLGVQTRKFSVGMASQFIEYLNAFAAQNNVKFKGEQQ
ncbi:MAG TPA: recombination protein NinB [Telluria sp.]|nr:recombination protein NinB [Telluria sp.]